MNQGDKNSRPKPNLESLEDRTVPSGSPWVLDPSKVDLSKVMIHFKTQYAVHTEPNYYAKGVDVVRTFDLTPGIYQVDLDKSVDYAKTLDALSKDARISRIDQNFRMFASAVPNDTRYGELYGLNNTGQSGGKAGADIDAQKAWDIGKGTGNTIVAVVDSGVDYNHPDLIANLWKNPGEIPGNGIDDDGNLFIDDVYGIDTVNKDSDPMDDDSHGTHVSGTIGATGNNNLGVVGVAWKTRIMGVKALGPTGGTNLTVFEAMEYSIKMGASIVNMSLGGGGMHGDFFDIGIQNAGKKGIIIVAAAGNGGSDGVGDNNDSVANFPSNYTADNIVAVAATDRNDNITGFSNFGITSVDIGAPGADILSTVPGGGYSSFNGTSMATPQVAGALVVMRDYNPTLTYKEYINLLYTGAEKIPSLNGRVSTGARLNLFNSMPPSLTIGALVSLGASSTSVFLGDRVTFTATVAKPTSSEPIPTGKVDLLENNVVLASANLDSNGTAVFPAVTMSKEGKRQFSVKYTATPGGRYQDGASSGVVITTTGRATNLTSFVKVGDTLTSSIAFGQTITLLAHMNAPNLGAALPTGSLEFFINSKSVGTRSVSLVNNQLQAQMNLDGLPLGSFTTYATYKGDSIYGSSVSPAIRFTVVKAATKTVAVPQSDAAVVGETFAIQGLVSASVGAKIQGRVQFRLNGSPLGSPINVNADGTVLLRNTFLLSQIGKNRQVTASFTDTSGNYSGSTSPVVPILITNTKTRLDVPGFAKIGDSVTFTATVSQVPGSAGTLGGYVEFFDGTKSLGTGDVDPATGIATFSSSTLEARQYLVRARYVNTSGSGVVDSGLSAPSTLLISRGGPAVTFTASPTSDTFFGANADFQIQVAPPSSSMVTPTGTVVLLFGSQEIFRVSLDGLGNASFSLTPDQYKVGANSVTARYLGDGNYAGSDGTTANFQVVKAPTDTVVVVTDLGGNDITSPVPFGSPINVLVFVTNGANNAEPKGTVLLSALINGKENPLGQLNVVPTGTGTGQSFGELKLDKLPIGDYQIKARFVDNDRFVGSDALPDEVRIIPGPASVSILGPNKFRAKGQTTLTAVVDDGTGNSPVGIVRFTNLDNNQVLGEATVNTDKNGSLAILNFTNTFVAGPVNVKAEFISSKPGTNNADTQVQLTITDKPGKFGITVSSSSVRVGDSLTINVSLDAPVPADFDPAAVLITDNGNIIKPGDITLSSPFVQNGNTFSGAFTYALTTVGTHRLTARYLGTVYTEPGETAPMDVLARPRVVSVTSTGAVIISDAAGKAASTVLSSENLKLVATVSNSTTSINPEGTLTFVAIKNGVETTLGSVAVKPLSTNQAVGELLLPDGITPSGTYSLVARFTSTGDFAASASQGKSLKVVDGPAAVTFVGLTTLLSGTNTTLTVKVDDGTGRTPTGKVTFYNDATLLGSADVIGGQASLNLPNGLPGGILPIRAEFVSSTFAGANNSTIQNFTVQADTKVTLLTEMLAYKSTDLITVNITVEFPITLPPAKVQLTDNGRLIATLNLTLNNTTGKFETSHQMTGLTIGSHRLVAKYLGTDLTSVKSTAPRTIIVRR